MLFIVLGTCAPLPDTEPLFIAHAAEIEWTPETIEAEAYRVAREYGLSDVFVETMRYESMDFTWNDQSLIEADGPNGREDSWGVCQIHLPSWPEISKEEALDPHFCLTWSAEKFAQGDARLWSAYRILTE